MRHQNWILASAVLVCSLEANLAFGQRALQGESGEDLSLLGSEAQVRGAVTDNLETSGTVAGGELPAEEKELQIGILSAGESIWIDQSVPCAVSVDPCTGDYTLPVGHAVAKKLNTQGTAYTWGRTWYADSYCGWGDNAGSVPRTNTLYLTIPDAWYMDESTTEGGDAKFVLSTVYEYSSSDCSGTARRSFGGDTATCSSTASGQETMLAYVEYAANCVSGYGDPIPCHRPDNSISAPPEGTYSYWYSVTAEWWSGSTRYSQNSSSGCFTITWY